MDNPAKILERNNDQRQDRNPSPAVRLENTDYRSHKTKVTITTKSSSHIPDQIIYPIPLNFPSSRVSGSVKSETETQASYSGCSAQTQKTGTATAPATIVLVKDGIEHFNNGKYARALKSFSSVLKFQMICRGEDDDPLMANMLANIGLVYLRQDQHKDATETLEKAVNMMRRLIGKKETNNDEQIIATDAPLAGVLNNLGTAKFLQGDNQGSFSCYWEAIRCAKTHSEASNKKELANSLYNIGRISALQKDYSTALDTLSESLQLERELHGEESIETVDTLNLVGFVYYSTEVFDRAIFMFTKALSIVTACIGSINERVAVSIINVGMVLEREGDFDEALRCYSTAQAVCKKVGLDEKNRTMHTAIRSSNDIRRQLSLVQGSKSDRHRDTIRETTEPSFCQSEKTSMSPEARSYRHQNGIRDTARKTCESSYYHNGKTTLSPEAKSYRHQKGNRDTVRETTESPLYRSGKTSLSLEAKSNSHQKSNRDTVKEITESPFYQSENTSTCSNPVVDGTPKKFDPSFTIRTENKNDMDTYAAFKERRKLERDSTEYREDPNWEVDNSSIVEEDREN